jgi:hypothetical protein
MIMTDFEAYKMYLALKAHFLTDQYDVVKMQGRIRASRRSYTGNKELIFKKLVKRYTDHEVCNFMVSNFVAGNLWGGVFDEESVKRYTAWQRRTQSLRYVFETDLQTLSEEAAGADWFTAEAGRHPLIIKAFLRNSITPETLVILNRLTRFVDNVKLDADPVWPDIRRLIVKYQPFLKFNLDQFQQILDGQHGSD